MAIKTRRKKDKVFPPHPKQIKMLRELNDGKKMKDWELMPPRKFK